MNTEQMQKIVDGAPEWATHFNMTENKYYPMSEPFIKGDIWLIDLRTELAKHEPMDLRDVDIPHGTIVLEK